MRLVLSDTITLPQDSIIDNSVSLFKEILPYKFKRGKEDRKGKLIFGYEGNPDGVKIDILLKFLKTFKRFHSLKKKVTQLAYITHLLIEIP